MISPVAMTSTDGATPAPVESIWGVVTAE
jgi:hypothetical protein